MLSDASLYDDLFEPSHFHFQHHNQPPPSVSSFWSVAFTQSFVPKRSTTFSAPIDATFSTSYLTPEQTKSLCAVPALLATLSLAHSSASPTLAQVFEATNSSSLVDWLAKARILANNPTRPLTTYLASSTRTILPIDSYALDPSPSKYYSLAAIYAASQLSATQLPPAVDSSTVDSSTVDSSTSSTIVQMSSSVLSYVGSTIVSVAKNLAGLNDESDSDGGDETPDTQQAHPSSVPPNVQALSMPYLRSIALTARDSIPTTPTVLSFRSKSACSTRQTLTTYVRKAAARPSLDPAACLLVGNVLVLAGHAAISGDGAYIELGRTTAVRIDEAVATIYELEDAATTIGLRCGAIEEKKAAMMRRAKGCSKTSVTFRNCARYLRLYNAELVTLEATALNLTRMVLTLRSQLENVALVETMRRARDEMRSLNEMVGGVDNVEEVVDEVHEAQTEVDEISERMGASLSLQHDAEAEEDLKVLEEALGEGCGSDDGSDGGALSLPEPPSKPVAGAPKLGPPLRVPVQNQE